MPALIGIVLIIIGILAFFVLPPLWGIISIVVGGFMVFASSGGGA